MTPAAVALAAACWPGGLTVVVPQRPDVPLPAALAAGTPTVGLRVPDHDAPRVLARAVGPLPTTSANVSGLPEASDAARDPRSARRFDRSHPRRRAGPRRARLDRRRLQRCLATRAAGGGGSARPGHRDPRSGGRATRTRRWADLARHAGSTASAASFVGRYRPRSVGGAPAAAGPRAAGRSRRHHEHLRPEGPGARIHRGAGPRPLGGDARRAPPPARQDRADRQRELRLGRGDGGAGLVADQQVRRGPARQALLRRLRVRRRRRAARPGACPGPLSRVPSTSTSSRIRAPRPTWPPISACSSRATGSWA